MKDPRTAQRRAPFLALVGAVALGCGAPATATREAHEALAMAAPTDRIGPSAAEPPRTTSSPDVAAGSTPPPQQEMADARVAAESSPPEPIATADAAPDGGADAMRSGAGALAVQGDRFTIDGKPAQLFGIRVASATKDDATTAHLVAQLDEYVAHGANAITPFLQGSSAAAYRAFSADGRTIDPGHKARMERILQEAGRRGMTVIVGIFYQNAPALESAEAYRQATRAVATAFRPYRNAAINIANENNSGNWADTAGVFDLRSAERNGELCALVHEVDPARVCGSGGYDFALNVALGRQPAIDALFFDTNSPSINSGDWYDRFVQMGIRKPAANVETFGAAAPASSSGVYSDAQKAPYLAELDATKTRPGLSILLFTRLWMQNGSSIRFDLGGDGRSEDPGIRWFFQHIARVRGLPVPPRDRGPPGAARAP
jgi:hypothetical protein